MILGGLIHKSEWEREGYGHNKRCNIRTVVDWLILITNSNTIHVCWLANPAVFTGGR